MTVPSGNEGRTVPLHVSNTDDKVLEDFIQGMSQVNMAVGVGRPVMKNEERGPFAGIQDFLVYIHIKPFLKNLGLFFLQLGFHGKAGPGKVKRVFPFRRFVFCHMYSPYFSGFG